MLEESDIESVLEQTYEALKNAPPAIENHSPPKQIADPSKSTLTTKSSENAVPFVPGAICGQCNKEIVTQQLQAMEKFYHVECFMCCVCNTQMFQEGKTKNYTVVDDKAIKKPYCDDCIKPIFEELNQRRSVAKNHTCFVCNTSIGDEEFMQSSDIFLHTKCFFCTRCNGDLDPLKIFNVGGKLCCDKCAQQVQRSRSASFSVQDI
eukprot:TRINITY_DN4637_c0_g1_i5.p1 TRINITY_DN4637_c0_g1~~TRINITY_DN4637_c0_g1_i5.p1  ORF type:complete len:206 (-),score=34.43 TRINITY_DN4637_c0_g1_i5:42-659(-)